MKFIFLIVFLIVTQNILSQEIQYSIHFPSGNKMSVSDYSDSSETHHFYSFDETKNLAEPEIGWSAFYENLKASEYPQNAKKNKLQSSMFVIYKIDENGQVIDVLIRKDQNKKNNCEDCEKLITNFIKSTKWIPGKIGETAVKTIDAFVVQFRIYDPNSKIPKSPFGN